MRLSRIWRILQIKEGVIDRGQRPRWITPSEICRILHILRKLNSIIALLFIQNISSFLRRFASIVSVHPYCARLHAQIHMPRHTSSARQVLKWAMIGQMAIAIALLGFNDFGRSLRPIFLYRNRLYLQLSPHCSKMNKKSMWEVKKIQNFCSRDIESCHLAAARRVKLWSLNANLFFEEPHLLTKFA